MSKLSEIDEFEPRFVQQQIATLKAQMDTLTANECRLEDDIEALKAENKLLRDKLAAIEAIAKS